MKVLQCFFGFSCFRAAQSWAVDRCNMGLNSLLVMPTGAGKSICYQIPAIIQDGLTIVVSPLIALMQDQIKKLPLTLPGACLSGDLTTQEVARISSLVIDGMIKVLFVSPERLCTPSFRFLMKNLQTRHATMGNTTHAVSLLCVDEAHCLSSWSYNFRPAFLRITRELPFINPGAILALTATAPPYIQTDIMSHLKIPSEGVNAAPYRRDNVRLHAFIAMNEEHRRSIVMALLDSSKRVDKRDSSGIKVPSTIIYVWRRADAENMSEFLKSSGINAIAYHAGMDSDARKRAQQMFDRGTANVIAATTSFGMGVDKSDVRRVIHTSLPKSIEAYLQETGRAGRDAEEAHCHLILTKDDFLTQAALAHSARLSRIQVFLLLARSFITVNDIKMDTPVVLRSSFVIRMDDTERSVDISAISVETILSLLELPPYGLLRIDALAMDGCKGSLMPTVSKQSGNGDTVLEAIIKLNRVKKESAFRQDAENHPIHSLRPTGSDGMGPSSYGLGDSGALFVSGRGSLITEFDVSLFSIMQTTGLLKEDVTKTLYALQKTGSIREYNLYDNAVFASFTDSSETPISFDTPQEYFNWVWKLAEDLHHQLLVIENMEAKRIMDVWRLGNAISIRAPSHGDIQDREDSTFQQQLSSFLNEYINSATSDAPMSAESSDFAGLFLNDAVISNAFKDESKFADAVNRDVNMLITDLRIKSFITDLSSLYRKATHSDRSALSKCIMEELRSAKAIYITRLMHGLGTTVFPATAWRDNGAWVKYRHLSFETLLNHVTKVLLSRSPHPKISCIGSHANS